MTFLRRVTTKNASVMKGFFIIDKTSSVMFFGILSQKHKLYAWYLMNRNSLQIRHRISFVSNLAFTATEAIRHGTFYFHWCF
jgi:hypothetical protein